MLLGSMKFLSYLGQQCSIPERPMCAIVFGSHFLRFDFDHAYQSLRFDIIATESHHEVPVCNIFELSALTRHYNTEARAQSFQVTVASSFDVIAAMFRPKSRSAPVTVLVFFSVPRLQHCVSVFPQPRPTAFFCPLTRPATPAFPSTLRH